MGSFALVGAVLTALSLALLATGGYLAARLLLGPRADVDRLGLAIATLLLAVTEAVAIGIVLGASGALRLPVALLVQTVLVALLDRVRRRRQGTSPDTGGSPGRDLLGAAWRRARESPILSLIALHAAGTELLRGLLRPPLSWDSLMYHVWLTATWLEQGSFALVPARHPTTFYEFVPANGSLWTWWWMAPSHSELFVNLAFVPQWLLLGLAAGGVARELGARRHWPVAAYLTLLTPTVVRFVATQYVDIAMGAALVAGTFFAIRWWRSASFADAGLLGIGAGLAAGTKVLGLPFGAALGGLAALLARGSWRRRTVQLGVAAALAVLLGGYFYGRNLAAGGGAFAYPCAKEQAAEEAAVPGGFPSPDSVLMRLPEILRDNSLIGTFLGANHPVMVELGVGPQVLLLALAFLAMPLLARRLRGRVAWLVWGQVAFQLVVWVTVPYAGGGHIFANTRYLVGGLGLVFAAAVALAEDRLTDPWLRGLAITLAIQDLLMLNPRMPLGVRMVLALALGAAVAVAASSGLRRVLHRRRRPLAAVAALALLALVPRFASFRVQDRERAFGQDYIAHLATTRLFAAGWGWLDANAGNGTVAVSHAPENFFVYPAMGPFLERRAVYVNVNEANHSNPLLYPACRTRSDPSPEAWIANLRAEGVAWLYVARYPEFEFPEEDAWAQARPDLFRLRFADRTNRVYEVAPPDGSPTAPQPAEETDASAARSTS